MTGRIQSLTDLHQLLRGYQAARVLHAAVAAGLLERLEPPATAAEAALRAGTSLRGAEILLDALAALGVAAKEGDRYRLTDIAAEHLAGPGGLAWAVDHHERLYRRWAHLPEAVREGALPPETREALLREPGGRRAFLRAMAAYGAPKAAAIAAALELSGTERILDAGGGPGTYLAALLQREPALSGVLLDLAPALAEARTFLAAAGVAGRVRLLPGDLLEGDGPLGEGGFDLALLSNVLHIYDPDENLRILRRLHASLRPGGRLLVQDYFLDATGTAPLAGALFAVNMLVATPGGRAWREEEAKSWLAAAGFAPPEPLPVAVDSQVWVARRP